VPGPDGKARRLRIPRLTLRQVAAKLRVMRRFELLRDAYTKGAGYNPYRVERQGLENYINGFLNGALRMVPAAP